MKKYDIGENGSLAFNNPPADFDTKEPFILVDLDQAYREKQVTVGRFDKIEDVPKQAISMSINQFCKPETIVLSVPGTKKADAVSATVSGPRSNLVPATALLGHPNCYLLLDHYSSQSLP